jgi:hypothetical protein
MDRKKLLDAADTLTNLVRNIHIRRELSAVRADPHLVFWRLIYGDLVRYSCFRMVQAVRF